jgi:hypothetical protein
MKAGTMVEKMAEKWDGQLVVDWDAYLVQLSDMTKAGKTAGKMAGKWDLNSAVDWVGLSA